MRSSAFLGVLPLALALSGCCGGYSVVRTSVLSGAALRPDAADGVTAGAAYVLRYSRLGEPPNACGSGMQYVEKLSIQVPSVGVGQAHVIGQPGVVATYRREQDDSVVGASKITGSIRINEIEGREVLATLSATIVLTTGEVVELDDDYEFHPDTGR